MTKRWHYKQCLFKFYITTVFTYKIHDFSLAGQETAPCFPSDSGKGGAVGLGLSPRAVFVSVESRGGAAAAFGLYSTTYAFNGV